MATFSRIKVWVSNEVLTAAALNAEFDNIINNMTPSGIEDASANVAAMQTSVNPGGLGTESLATSLLGEIQRLRYVISRIVNMDLSQKWYEAPVRSLADLNIDTVDIVDGAVTPIKLSTKNLQKSPILTSSSQTTTSTSFVDVAGLSVSITTVGRPVRLFLVANGVSAASIGTQGTGAVTSSTSNFAFVRGTTVIADYRSTITQNATQAGSAIVKRDPVSILSTVDEPAAGTYTYKLQFKAGSATDTASILGDVYLYAEEIS